MFTNAYGFNRGCGCGGTTVPTTSTCGCSHTHTNTCGCGQMNSCGCGSFAPTVTPITLPETTNFSHCCMYHEQPVIQPIENRTVRHHNFYPRVYVTSRYTNEEVIEPNTAATMYTSPIATTYANPMATTPIYPSFTNYMNTL